LCCGIALAKRRNIDILFVLSICFVIHNDKWADRYTLQRYNCYFVSWVIIVITMRKSAVCRAVFNPGKVQGERAPEGAPGLELELELELMQVRVRARVQELVRVRVLVQERVQEREREQWEERGQGADASTPKAAQRSCSLSSTPSYLLYSFSGTSLGA
jgi:hypothetical protein